MIPADCQPEGFRKETDMKLYFFNCGVLKSTKDCFVQGAAHEPFDVPIPYFLIQYKGKNILFDTGLHKDDKDGHLLPRLVSAYTPEFTEDQLSYNAIRKVGVEPEDIDILILSHLHFDHAGCIDKFPNATVIVRKSEYDYVRRPEYYMAHTYYSDEAPALTTEIDADGKAIDPKDLQGTKWFFLKDKEDDRFDLFRDGRIVIYFTPGHTVGHQSLYVRTDEDGEFMLCADASYTRENVDNTSLPGVVENNIDFLQNLRLFQLMEKTGVKIITGHDPEEWKSFRHAPEEFYQ